MSADKTCFFICEFGDEGSEARKRAEALQRMIKRAIDPLGYQVIRADQINDPGIITNKIIEYLTKSDLVVADLTNNNPNVYYELAVRHAANRPVIQMMEIGGKLPFDVQLIRTIFYDLTDFSSADDAITKLGEFAKTVDNELATNPLSFFISEMNKIGPVAEPPMQQWLLDFFEAHSSVIKTGKALEKYAGNYYAYHYSTWALNSPRFKKPVIRSLITIGNEHTYLSYLDHGFDHEEPYKGGLLVAKDTIVGFQHDNDPAEFMTTQLFPSAAAIVQVLYGADIFYYDNRRAMVFRPCAMMRIPEDEEISKTGVALDFNELPQEVAEFLLCSENDEASQKYEFLSKERYLAYLELPRPAE